MKTTRFQRGQAMIEYALIVVVLAVTLFSPVWPDPRGSGRLSIFGLFAATFEIYVDSFHSVITMPIP